MDMAKYAIAKKSGLPKQLCLLYAMGILLIGSGISTTTYLILNDGYKLNLNGDSHLVLSL